MPPIIFSVALGGALLLGVIAGYVFRYIHALSQKNSIELEIKEREIKAEEKAHSIIEKAEAKADSIEADAKTERKEQEAKLNQKESRLDKREELLDERQIDIDSGKEALEAKIEEIKSIKARLDTHVQEADQKLEAIAGLTKGEAFEQIVAKVTSERAEDLRARIENELVKKYTRPRQPTYCLLLFTGLGILCHPTS